MRHLENRLVLGLDALQEARLRQDELEVRAGQLVVRLGLRPLLYKLRQVALRPARTSFSALFSLVHGSPFHTITCGNTHVPPAIPTGLS